MITFKQFLQEEDVELTPEQIAEQIERNCGPYLKENGREHWLFRGQRGVNVKFSENTTRKNRQPKDTSIHIHEIVDEVFLEKYGHRFRSNAVFTSGHLHFVMDFGKPFYFFPIGDFDYLWSRVVEDAYLWFDSVGGGGIPYVIKKGFMDKGVRFTNDDYEKELRKILSSPENKLDYEFNQHLDDAVVSGHEVMVDCNKFYLLRTGEEGTTGHKDWEFSQEVIKLLSRH